MVFIFLNETTTSFYIYSPIFFNILCLRPMKGKAKPLPKNKVILSVSTHLFSMFPMGILWPGSGMPGKTSVTYCFLQFQKPFLEEEVLKRLTALKDNLATISVVVLLSMLVVLDRQRQKWLPM